MSHKVLLPQHQEDRPIDFRVRLLNLFQYVMFTETVTVTASGTTALQLLPSVILCDATTGNQSLTLLQAANCRGIVYVIKKIDSSANTVTINPNGSELIEGALTQILTVQWASVTIICNGVAWYNI